MSVQDEVPKSRITLTYKTEVDGEPAVVDLPLRMMVLGDFSQGSSKDRKVDLDERNLRSLNGSNINEIMKDMGVEVDMVVQDKINPSGQDMRVQLKLENLNSFSPEEVAKQVPQIRSLLLLKKLLEEIQSNVANKKEFAALLNKLFSSDALLQQMREKLQNFSNYRIPNKQLALEGSKSIEIGGEQL
ncbi:MAG: type VI secretion system contractile sheath small subunit [Parachlamydia sp.]|jgi:type VI secretion system protein ImpB|nr:type VI secretion system contractile sheath small subunit [Parachlamydia sp.]